MPMEFNPENISLVIGLGNPGKEYANTFHNVGQILLFSLCGSEGFSSPRPSFFYKKSGNLSFIIPKTFMNESGIAVSDALVYFKNNPEQLLVIHDDTDLELGDIKLQFGRGDAGHNGIKSVIKHLGTDSFWRLRIGVRKKTDSSVRPKAEAIVLKEIKVEDKKIIMETETTIREMLQIKNL